MSIFSKSKNVYAKPAQPLAWVFIVLGLVGAVVTYIDANLSYNYGLTVNNTTAYGLAALSVGAGLLPIVVIMFWRQGFQDFAKVLSVAAATLFMFNITSNMGVSSANRTVENDKAVLQQTKLETKAQDRTDAKADIKQFSARLNALLDKQSVLTSKVIDGWKIDVAPTSVASATRLVSEKEAERSREAQRGCRTPPCKGPLYEKRSRELDHLLAIQSMAVDIEKLESKIAASRRVVAAAREKLDAANSAEAGINHTASIGTTFTRWTYGWTGAEANGGNVRTVTEAMGFAMALAIAIGSVTLNLAGVFPQLMAITQVSDAHRSAPLRAEAASPRPPEASDTLRGEAPNTQGPRVDVQVIEREPQINISRLPYGEFKAWREQYERGAAA